MRAHEVKPYVYQRSSRGMVPQVKALWRALEKYDMGNVNKLAVAANCILRAVPIRCPSPLEARELSRVLTEQGVEHRIREV